MIHKKPPIKSVLKKHTFESFLERGDVLLHINPKVKEEIKLPPILDEAYNVVLCLGYNTPHPIPDLTLTDNGVEATLTANNEQFFCLIPWTSIYYMGVVGELGQGWPSDAPLALFHHWHLRLAAPPEEIRETLENEGVSTVYEDGDSLLLPKKERPFSIINGDGEGGSTPPSSHFLTLLAPSDS